MSAYDKIPALDSLVNLALIKAATIIQYPLGYLIHLFSSLSYDSQEDWKFV